MRILFLVSAYNGLTQRAHVELLGRGHEVSIELATSPESMREAVSLFGPDLIVCPFLKQKVPADIWRSETCIIVHPGIVGDRGPSSLDWAITNGEEEWGVTALEAAEEMDAGDIWATATFPMREATKASLYRNEVTQAAMEAIHETVEKFASGSFRPTPLDYEDPAVRGRLRPAMKQADRRIDWSRESSEEILRKIRAADSAPGVLDKVFGEHVYLYGGSREESLRGEPGEVVAQRDGAICRATVDGAVWISHLKKRKQGGRTFFKLPAAQVLAEHLEGVPELALPELYTGDGGTFREIWYEEEGEVGILNFDFYNGAMDTDQCHRLKEAFLDACARPTKVIVLASGVDFWSNGIHLNRIEAAADPAVESWRNINAIDDLVEAILLHESRLVISGLQGNAGAGGAILALAGDRVYGRSGIVLNPHYRAMGGLYGSEYWTYLLPRRVGPTRAIELTEGCLPVGMDEALEIGLVDEVLPNDPAAFRQELRRRAQTLATGNDFGRLLAQKVESRRRAEALKPLAEYRQQELEHMLLNFFGPDRGYHRARTRFVRKAKPEGTPLRIAVHRREAVLEAAEQRVGLQEAV